MLKSSQFKILSWIIILFLTAKLCAQSNQIAECGTPDITPAENIALLNGLVNPQVSGQSVSPIPIWLTLVQQNNGYSIWNDLFSPLQLISDINAYFSNGMSFVLCGVSIVQSDDWYILSTNSNTIPPQPSEWAALRSHVDNLNSSLAKGYIDVMLVGGLLNGSVNPPGGIAAMPNGNSRGSVVVAVYSPDYFAHELGHYFGLTHTFANGPFFNPNAPEAAQYVDAIVEINGISYNSSQTGDYIPDTPADPGSNFCSETPTCTIINGCTILDPIGKTYRPDPTLLMSYYSQCRNRFSPNQLTLMLDVFTSHANWAFLRDPANSPMCQSNFPDGIGRIRRNCDGIFSLPNQPAPAISPIKDVSVSLRDLEDKPCGVITPKTSGSGLYSPFFCTFPSYSGNGLLSLYPNKSHGDQTNGITVSDLMKINKHILGIESFTNPFQYIAADENKSGTVTTLDVFNIRKAITFPQYSLIAGSWRYVPEYCFEDQAFYDEFYDDDDFITPGTQPNPFPCIWKNPDETNGEERHYSIVNNNFPNTDSWMDQVSIDPNGLGYSSKIPWSFWAVKVGDVDCTAKIESINETSEDDSFISSGHSQIEQNQIFIVELKINGADPISAWQLGIEFAADSMEFIDILPGNASESFSLDNFGLEQVLVGELIALDFSPTGVASNLDNKIIFKIKMKALKTIDNITDHFRTKNKIIEKLFYDQNSVELSTISLKLEIENAEEFGFVRPHQKPYSSNGISALKAIVYPTPFSSELNFDFSINKPDFIRLSLFDNIGRLITTHSEFANEGFNSIKLTNLDQPSGLFWYLLETTDETYNGKIFKN